MQLRHAAIVAVEERQEVRGQVVLVARVQRAHDAEVDGGIARVRRVRHVHEDIARMHVGVEKVVLEHLREENLHAVFAQLLEVGAEFAQLRDVGNLHAVHALHHHHIHSAQVPIDRRHMNDG